MMHWTAVNSVFLSAETKIHKLHIDSKHKKCYSKKLLELKQKNKINRLTLFINGARQESSCA